MVSRHISVLALSAVFVAGASASLIITPTYTGFTAQQITAFNYAINEYQTAFTDNIHVNLKVQATNSGLGGSSTNLVGFGNYALTKFALTADRTTAADFLSVANMGSDPTGGAQQVYSKAQAKAMGLIGDDLTTDGTISINTLGGFNFTYDPNNRQVAGDFDFIGVAEHEIAEVMGRISLEGNTLGAGHGPLYDPFDMFRYTPGGVHSISAADTNVYFSINGGSTSIFGYNGPGNGGDIGDLNGADPTDPYNAFTGPNQGHALNSNDLTQMDVIGWDRKVVPEPASMIALGLGAAAFIRRRKAAK